MYLTSMANSKSQINLTCMYLDCSREPEYLEPLPKDKSSVLSTYPQDKHIT